jgi:type 1 glutamine amidotransferase
MGSGGSALAGGSNGSGGAQGGAGAAPEAGIMPGSSDGAVDRSAPDAQNARDGATLPKRVLLYHFSTLVIPTVPAQLTFLRSKLTEWQYESDDSVDPAQFTDDNLSRYGAVAMVNTCFEPFGAGKPDRPQSEALQRFVQRGGGLFGTHCAAVTFQSAQPPVLYNQLIGGRGGGVPFDGTSDCRKLADHASSALLPPTFAFIGNLDEADYVAPDSVVLVRCKRAAPDGKDVAVSWYRTEGSGRVFYTNFAKVDADLKDPTLGAQHILPALSWILGR